MSKLTAVTVPRQHAASLFEALTRDTTRAVGFETVALSGRAYRGAILPKAGRATLKGTGNGHGRDAVAAGNRVVYMTRTDPATRRFGQGQWRTINTTRLCYLTADGIRYHFN